MSSAKDHLIIYLRNQSEKQDFKIKLKKEFVNFNDLKRFVNKHKNRSFVVVISNEISLESFPFIDQPQIVAVFDSNLNCLSSKESSINDFIQKAQEDYGKTAKRTCRSHLLTVIEKHWFLMGLLFVLYLAYLFPQVGKTGGYIRSEWTVKWTCIILVFFLSGLSVKSKDLFKEILNIRVHLFIQIFSFLIIPLVVYQIALLVVKTSFNKVFLISILIISSTSTTISSNVIMTKNASGNECAALLNAVLGNTLGIFISPILIYFLTKNSLFQLSSDLIQNDKKLDYFRIVKNLSLTVLIPLIVGQIIHSIWPKQIKFIREKFHFSKLNSFILLILVWSMFCDVVAAKIFEKITKKDFLFVSLIDAMIYNGFALIILFLARLPIKYWQYTKSDTIAIVFCGASKSLAMGISLMNAFYHNETLISLLSLPFIIYHIEQLIFGAIWATLLIKWNSNQQTSQDDQITDIPLNNQSHFTPIELES